MPCLGRKAGTACWPGTARGLAVPCLGTVEPCRAQACPCRAGTARPNGHVYLAATHGEHALHVRPCGQMDNASMHNKILASKCKPRTRSDSSVDSRANKRALLYLRALLAARRRRSAAWPYPRLTHAREFSFRTKNVGAARVPCRSPPSLDPDPKHPNATPIDEQQAARRRRRRRTRSGIK